MPINRSDVERVLAKAKGPAIAFLVRYTNDRKKVDIRYTDINQINFDAAVRITVVFPERSQGLVWKPGADEYVDLSRKRVRPARKQGKK